MYEGRQRRAGRQGCRGGRGRGRHIDRQTREQPHELRAARGRDSFASFASHARHKGHAVCEIQIHTDNTCMHPHTHTHRYILQTDTHPHSRGRCYHDSLSAIRTTQRGINETHIPCVCVLAVQGMRCRLSLHLSPDFGHIDRLFGFDSDSLAGDQ